ncbi:hypothetical protein RJ639_040342 [Escallonia herrerae]|uniref:Meiosis-specific protein ASY3-like coiled-coil domain-containing protein n=1 Tax=Escallonia herrerae TaxID=1293975 RepID=A0AA88WFK7_9ASTE|nr:hypothetical protein RJ639_040342 [Escallonia herrerae]
MEEYAISTQGNSNGDRQYLKGVKASTMEKQSEAPEQENSPWVSTRSFHQNVPSPEVVCSPKQTSTLPVSSCKLDGVIKGKPESYSVQFFANQTSILQARGGMQKKFNSVTYRRNGGREDDTVPRMKETAQEVLVPEKEVVEDKTKTAGNQGNESLRMKLWDILGTVSSPNKQTSNSQALEKGANSLKAELSSDEKRTPMTNPRENSDTVESDSESPNQSTRRPVTRSLTQKRSSTKVQRMKGKHVASHSHEQKHREKSLFSFEEGLSGRLCAAGPSMSSRKKSEKKSSTNELLRTCSLEQENLDQASVNRNKAKTAVEKSSLLGHTIGSFKSSPPEKKIDLAEAKNDIQQKDSDQTPVMKMTHKLGDIDRPTLEENVDQQENLAIPSLTNIARPEYDLSPTFGLKAPSQNFSPNMSPEPNHCSPPQRVFNTGGIRSFKSLQNSKPDYYKTYTYVESPDGAGELEDSPDLKSVTTMKKYHTECRLYRSSSEERDSESAEDDSPIEGNKGTELLSPEIGTPEKPNFVLRPPKRHRGQEDAEITEFRSEESKGFHRPLQQTQGDGLASAVSLFALALERVKSKMKSRTSKISAEKLMSVSEDIHLQLQNAESQIQTNVSTLEGLDAHQIEFKGTVERQRALQRKLLLQAEEAIEAQLHEAHRKITAVHKLARDKMLQLKYVIAECLKEGVLT